MNVNTRVIKQHMYKHSSGIPANNSLIYYKCDTCQYTASRKEHLMKHKKAFHEYKRQ